MGGRGSFAAGNPVPYVYEVDTSFFAGGKFNRIKVLKGINGSGKHGLPESSHSSFAYLKMNPDGTFHTMRIYDNTHHLRIEIAYNREPKVDPGVDKVLHYHVYGKEFSHNKSGRFERTTIRMHKNSRLYRQYKKFFVGVKL